MVSRNERNAAVDVHDEHGVVIGQRSPRAEKQSIEPEQEHMSELTPLSEIKTWALNSSSRWVLAIAEGGDLAAHMEIAARGIGASLDNASRIRDVIGELQETMRDGVASSHGEAIGVNTFAQQVDVPVMHYDAYPDEPLDLTHITRNGGLRAMAKRIITEPSLWALRGNMQLLVHELEARAQQETNPTATRPYGAQGLRSTGVRHPQ